jgi:phage tail-like protein
VTTYNPPPQRFDPYKNFKFRLTMGGQVVAGATVASGLPAASTVVQKPADSPVPTPPSRTKYDPITLKRGVTHDSSFQNWAGGNTPSSPGAGLHDLILETFDDAGHPLRTYTLHGCRVSDYKSLPDPGAEAREVAIEYMAIEFESWEPHTSLPKS